MNSSNISSKTAGAGVFAAIVASLCCITPVFSLLAGIGGIAATFSWMEPIRPYLVALTVGILGFAWYQKLKPKTAEEIECACEEDDKPSFWQTKRFLAIVSVFASVMLAFPSYSHVFYPELESKEMNSTSTMQLASFQIEGMTCAGCEEHIKHTSGLLPGVMEVNASYLDESAQVVFNASLINLDMLIDAINETGYTIVSSEVQPYEMIISDSDLDYLVSENIEFYSVPLVCNAASTLGCGSRARPILASLEKEEVIQNAWLNKAGNVIAVEWQENISVDDRMNIISSVNKTENISLKTISGSEVLELNASFSAKDGWYAGDDVFELSKEESGIIADRIIASVKEHENNNLNFADEAKFRGQIQDIFYEWFVNYESLDELSDMSEYRTRLTEITKIGEAYVGAGNMPGMDVLMNACSGAECSHESCKGSSTCKIGTTDLTLSAGTGSDVFEVAEGFEFIEFNIAGMTCSGCEPDLENKLTQLAGVDQVKASYDNGNAKISYDKTKISKESLIEKINSTSYKVIEEKE